MLDEPTKRPDLPAAMSNSRRMKEEQGEVLVAPLLRKRESLRRGVSLKEGTPAQATEKSVAEGFVELEGNGDDRHSGRRAESGARGVRRAGR